MNADNTSPRNDKHNEDAEVTFDGEIVVLYEEDSVPGQPSEAHRKRLEEKYGRPKAKGNPPSGEQK